MVIFFAGGMHECWWIDNREFLSQLLFICLTFALVGGLMKLLCLIEIERL